MRRARPRIVFDTAGDRNGICSVINKKSRDIVFRALQASGNGFYEAEMFAEQEFSAIQTTREKNHLSHQRSEHASNATLERTLLLLNGNHLDKTEPEYPCEPCRKGKSERSPLPSISTESRRATKPLELVHKDIVGPMNRSPLGGNNYFVHLYDDAITVSLVRRIKTNGRLRLPPGR